MPLAKFEIENIEDFYKSTHIVSWPVEEEGNPFKRHNRFSRAEESRENKPEKLETCWAPNTCQWILGSDGRPETPVGQWLGAPRSKLLWITGGPGKLSHLRLPFVETGLT